MSEHITPACEFDTIGHPAHYCAGRKYEPKDVIRDWDLNFNLGSAVKYIARCGRKDGNPVVTDLQKAMQYIQFEIDAIEEDNASANESESESESEPESKSSQK